MHASRRRVLIAAVSLSLAGCAAFATPEPLRVSVPRVEPLASEGLEWRMLLKLRVQNPNDAPIHYNGVSIKLDALDRTFASGVSDTAGIIPRFGESVMDVPVTISVLDIVSRAMRMAEEPLPGKITYRLEGTLHGPAFGSTRFESHGDLALPDPGTPFTGAQR